MSRNDVDRFVGMARSKIKPEDIMHRGFLKPIQIALKTFKTEIKEQSSKLKPDSLPAGLKIVVKSEVNSQKRNFVNIEQINEDDSRLSFLRLKEQYRDNMLSLMKKKGGIKLAICICMYSEDKKMLKSTLAGVAENVANLVAYEGLDPDDIGVFVMMDGIEKVDSSIISYFQELERSNNINLGTNIVRAESFEQIHKRQESMTDDQINNEEMKNVNNFLFTPAELEERNSLRFQTIRKQYDEIKSLLNQIQQLKTKKPLYDDLPNKLITFFMKEAREQRKNEFMETDAEANAISDEQIIKDYGTDINISRPIVMAALEKAKQFCKNYLQTREDLAYLAYFRKKVPYSIVSLSSQSDHQSERYHLNEEQQVQHTIMNLFLCVKYKNSGKLSSHNWFFNGFCKQLRPQYAVLLDVGLKPQATALMRMYKYMTKNKKVGGVCGYMSLKIQKLPQEEEVKDDEIDFLTSIVMKFFDIQRTQQVEYHFAHLMDKPFEASFGFIHVLPGAFSAYNMLAIFDYTKDSDDQLLKSYFRSIDQKLKSRKIVSSDIGVRNAILRTALPDFLNRYCISIDPDSDEAMLYNENVNLAEDRILCMGIHTRGYDMAYLPDAYAEVDPIKTVHGLLGQRKRWINGSYFAFEKVKKELSLHEKTNGFEFCLNIQILYLTLMNSLSYFSPSFFLFTVHIAMEAFREDVLVKVLGGVVSSPDTSQFYNSFVYTMDFIYVVLIMTIVFYSLHLTNTHKRFKPYIYGISTIFGLFMLAVFIVLAVDIFRGLIDNEAFLVQNQAAVGNIPGGIDTINIMRWILVGSLVIYLVPITAYILLFGNVSILFEIALGGLSFLFYGPTYLNILNIYSLCRIDDISWGTKGLDTASSANSAVKGSWKLIKFVHVAKYVIWNIILSVILLTLGSSYSPRFFVTIIMIAMIGISMSGKVLIAVLYMIFYKCRNFQGSREPNLNRQSRISKIIQKLKPEIMDQINNNLNDIKEDYEKNNMKNSFIRPSKSRVLKSYAKQKDESKMLKSLGKKSKLINLPMAKINEEPKIQLKKKEKKGLSPVKHDLKDMPKIKEEENSDLDNTGKQFLESPQRGRGMQVERLPSEQSLNQGFKPRDKSKDKEKALQFKNVKQG